MLLYLLVLQSFIHHIQPQDTMATIWKSILFTNVCTLLSRALVSCLVHLLICTGELNIFNFSRGRELLLFRLLWAMQKAFCKFQIHCFLPCDMKIPNVKSTSFSHLSQMLLSYATCTPRARTASLYWQDCISTHHCLYTASNWQFTRDFKSQLSSIIMESDKRPQRKEFQESGFILVFQSH